MPPKDTKSALYRNDGSVGPLSGRCLGSEGPKDCPHANLTSLLVALLRSFLEIFWSLVQACYFDLLVFDTPRILTWSHWPTLIKWCPKTLDLRFKLELFLPPSIACTNIFLTYTWFVWALTTLRFGLFFFDMSCHHMKMLCASIVSLFDRKYKNKNFVVTSYFNISTIFHGSHLWAVEYFHIINHLYFY